MPAANPHGNETTGVHLAARVKKMRCGGGIRLALIFFALAGAHVMHAQSGCTVNDAPASVSRIRASGWDLALSLGTCPAGVHALTLEWHELNADGTPTACRLHQEGDGDDGDREDESEERDQEGDARHRCGIIRVDPATGLARLKNLRFGATYSFTATAHSAPVVIAKFTVNLPLRATAAQLIFVNLLASVPTLAPAGTCNCIGPPDNQICPPEAKFLPLQSTLPTSPMSPGQAFSARLAFANCSHTTDLPTFETWTDRGGYFLKARPTFATDLTQWGFGTVPLPPNNPCYFGPCAVVPPGYVATFDFTLHAPMIPTKANPLPADQYQFTWSMRRETPAVQRWIDNPSTTAYLSVVKDTPSQEVFLCGPPGCTKPPCQTGPSFFVDPTGNNPSAESIQHCIDNTPSGGTLELPLGIYLMDKKVVVNHPMTLRTAGIPATSTDGCWSPYPTVTPCAVLQAMPEPPFTTPPTDHLFGYFGFFQVYQPVDYNHLTHNIDSVHIDHILIDGNRSARVHGILNQGPTEYACRAGLDTLNFTEGFDTTIACSNCSFNYSAVLNAVCGAGLNFYCELGEDGRCDNNLIKGNVIAGNGNQAEHLWADGLGYNGVGGTITGNYSVDGSGDNIIFGGTEFKNTAAALSHFRTISDNVVIQAKQHTFTALALVHFDNPLHLGSFQGDVVSGNRIDCGAGLHYCDYGIQIGDRTYLQGCSGPYQGADCTTSYISSISRYSILPRLPSGTKIPPNPNTCSYNLYGGTVTGNTVMNAKQGMIIDGAGASPLIFAFPGDPNCPSGSPGYPIRVYGNTVTGSAIDSPPFYCLGTDLPAGSTSVPITENINISDFYNFVDTNGTSFPFSTHTYCSGPKIQDGGYCPDKPPPPQSPNSAGYYCN